MQQKKIPMRMCKGCSEMKPKKQLIRIVKSPEGEISVDITGKKSGRGVYICPLAECLLKARKSRRFERDFEVKIENEIYEELEKQINEIGELNV